MWGTFISVSGFSGGENREGVWVGWEDKAALCVDESEEASFVVGRSITHGALSFPLMAERKEQELLTALL